MDSSSCWPGYEARRRDGPATDPASAPGATTSDGEWLSEAAESFKSKPEAGSPRRCPPHSRSTTRSPPLRSPRLDDQQRCLRLQPSGDDLGNVGKEQISSRPSADRSGENRLVGDLRLARPLGLLSSCGCRAGPCRANLGSRLRSAPLRAPPDIDANLSSPSANSYSIPEIRGDPSARNVAIVLCPLVSKSRRTRAANSGSACSTSFAAMATVWVRFPSVETDAIGGRVRLREHTAMIGQLHHER